MAEEKEDGEKAFIGCTLMLVLLPLTIALRGFVLTELWSWFVVPLGVMTITLWHAYGLAILVSLMTASFWPNFSEKEDERGIGYKVFKMIATAVAVPLILWGLGWCCYCAQRGV